MCRMPKSQKKSIIHLQSEKRCQHHQGKSLLITFIPNFCHQYDSFLLVHGINKKPIVI